MRKIPSGEINKIKKQFWGSQYFINRRAGQTNAAHCKSQQGDQRLQHAKPSGLTECLPGPSGPVDFKCNFATGLEGRHSTHRVETAAWTVSPFQGCCGGGDFQPAVHTAGKHYACPPARAGFRHARYKPINSSPTGRIISPIMADARFALRNSGNRISSAST